MIGKKKLNEIIEIIRKSEGFYHIRFNLTQHAGMNIFRLKNEEHTVNWWRKDGSIKNSGSYRISFDEVKDDILSNSKYIKKITKVDPPNNDEILWELKKSDSH